MKSNLWKKPELVIMTRSNPEEGVLSACKIMVQGSAGPGSLNNLCMEIPTVACMPCDGPAGS